MIRKKKSLLVDDLVSKILSDPDKPTIKNIMATVMMGNILRHPELFSDEAVEKSNERLNEWHNS